MADRAEIAELAHRYAVAVDRRDLDVLVGLFVPEARDRLRPYFAESLGALGTTILSVTTQVVDLDPADPDRATGVVYCTGEIDDPEEGWIRQSIVYQDSYARRDERWLFFNRNHQLFYGQRARSSPIAQPPANWPERQVGRGTLADTWRTPSPGSGS